MGIHYPIWMKANWTKKKKKVGNLYLGLIEEQMTKMKAYIHYILAIVQWICSTNNFRTIRIKVELYIREDKFLFQSNQFSLKFFSQANQKQISVSWLDKPLFHNISLMFIYYNPEKWGRKKAQWQNSWPNKR